MKKYLLVTLLTTSLFAPITVGCRDENNSGCSDKNDTTSIVQKKQTPTTYSFYIENSGSMKGYFTGNSDLKTIVTEFYHRLDGSFIKGVTINLNYINTGITRCNVDIQTYLAQTQNNCTASYTKLDEILCMAMDSLKNNQVNLVISDYCFSSNNGNFQTAQSGIDNIFTKRLKTDKDLAVAVFKYDCDFNGKYYPGGIPCTHKLPIYIWAFGASDKVKKISNLDIKEKSEILIFEQTHQIEPQFEVEKARMINKSENSIKVKEWDSDRNSDQYTLKFVVDFTDIAQPQSVLCDPKNYKLSTKSSSKYQILTIEQDKDNIYKFTVITDRPSPGELIISQESSLPAWVVNSNFDGTGVPPEGKTLGVKYLIDGVFDAFYRNNKNNVEIKINFK